MLLESDATYEILVVSSGQLTRQGSGSQRLRFYVLAPEPARPLLALVGATALGAAAGVGRRAGATLSRSAAAS